MTIHPPQEYPGGMGHAAARLRTTLKEIPLYVVPGAVHPKTRAAVHLRGHGKPYRKYLCTRSRGPRTLNPRGRAAAEPRNPLNEIPLYVVPGAVLPKLPGPQSCGTTQTPNFNHEVKRCFCEPFRSLVYVFLAPALKSKTLLLAFLSLGVGFPNFSVAV